MLSAEESPWDRGRLARTPVCRFVMRPGPPIKSGAAVQESRVPPSVQK